MTITATSGGSALGAGGSTVPANSAASSVKPTFGGNATFSAGRALGFGTTPAKGIFGASGTLC